jgi:DsbC/DsbD-like thiol-disulfide interchange protein
MKRVFIILLILFSSSRLLFAKSPFDQLENSNPLDSPIKVSALTNKSLVFPGEEFKFHLSIIVKTGWHIYSLSPLEGNEFLRTQIFIDENVFRKKGAWKESKPVLIQDGAVGRIVNGHKGNVEFSRTYLVPAEVEVDKHSINGKLIFRACDNHICTLPQELPFHASILVTNK